MTKKKKAGRPKKNKADKVVQVFAYLTPVQQKAIEAKYKDITKALKIKVLPEC